jgi:prolipoprotein diacylglyceryl transferase
MVIWNPSEVALSLGAFEIRWYSLMWCAGLAAAYYIVYTLYKRQQIPQEKFEPLFLYCFLGILIGARLGHCLLYEPAYFLSHPLEMILPMREVDGEWKFTGYAGLASHGGTAGLMFALWLYVRKAKMPLMHVLDNIAIATPITAGFIRLGNLMNSEIVGKYTGTDWGFVFAHNWDAVNRCHETMPRHPAQLYEAIAYFLFFIVGLVIYRKYSQRVGSGLYFGWCLFSIFTFRLFVEYFKEVQEPWEQTMRAMIGLDQGQLLSLPFIAIGGYYLWKGIKHKAATNINTK